MQRTTIAISFSLLVAGCATSSGVVPIGPDTYMVSKQSVTTFGSGGEVKAELYKEAGAYCASRNKHLMPVSTNSRDGAYGYHTANAELQFRCLDKGDRDLGRPTMTATPDVVIENRTK